MIVEFGGEGAQGTKSGKDERSNAGIGAHNDHDIGTPSRIQWSACPSAWALEEQAVEMVKLGPLAP